MNQDPPLSVTPESHHPEIWMNQAWRRASDLDVGLLDLQASHERGLTRFEDDLSYCARAHLELARLVQHWSPVDLEDFRFRDDHEAVTVAGALAWFTVTADDIITKWSTPDKYAAWAFPDGPSSSLSEAARISMLAAESIGHNLAYRFDPEYESEADAD